MVCFAFFSVLHLSRLLFSAGQPNFLGFTLPLPSAGPAGWRAGASGSAALTFHKCHLILSRPVPAVAGGLLGGVGPPGAAPRGSPRPRAQRLCPRRDRQGERGALAHRRPRQQREDAPRLRQPSAEATKHRQLQTSQHQKDRVIVAFFNFIFYFFGPDRHARPLARAPPPGVMLHLILYSSHPCQMINS